MNNALPTFALQLFLREARVGAPLRICKIYRAIVWAAHYLLRNCVDHKSELVFTSAHGILGPLPFGNFLSQRLVDRFKLHGAFGDAALQVLVEPLNFGT